MNQIASGSPQKRLLSLDVFRGITIAGMMIVNSPGNQTSYAPLDHAEWNGWTPTDLVFPFFVFILGVSLVFSFNKRREKGEVDKNLYRQIFRRTAIIFGLGLLLNGFPYNHLESIRIMGVLQRIALCYFLSSVLFLRFQLRTLIWVTVGLLTGYWLLMTRIPVPGFGIGNLSKEGNLAAYIDRMLLAGHLYRPEYDPEGILSTLPAVATALLGIFTGIWLSSKNQNKSLGMLTAGSIGIILGEICDRWFPINKALWSPSYVLFTGGAALILLSLCYWLIEVHGSRAWSKFFEVFGVNAIAAYVVSIFLLKIQNRIPMNLPDGASGNLRLFLTNHLFESWTSPNNASLLFALGYTFLWFLILSVLYKRRIFIKI